MLIRIASIELIIDAWLAALSGITVKEEASHGLIRYLKEMFTTCSSMGRDPLSERNLPHFHSTFQILPLKVGH